MKLEPVKLGNSIALAFSLVHFTFDILSLVAPEVLNFIFTSWFHGFSVRLNILDTYEGFSFSKMVFGLVTSVGVAWVIGYSIGFFYNFLQNKSNK